MWNRSTLLIAVILSLAAALTAAQAATPAAGQTANGCTYKVVNGQYLYNCDAKSPSPSAPQPAAVIQDNAQATEAAPAPMSAAPNMVPASAQAATAPAQTMKVVIAPPPAMPVRNEESAPQSQGNVVTYRNARDQLFDNTYVGASIGSSSLGAISGSGINLGVNLGTNIDEYMGLEFSYGYTHQNLYLNLAARSGSTSSPLGSTSSDDADLSSHMLAAEIHYHLTDAFKRLRPYGGIGLGWRKSNLEESANVYDPLNASTGGNLSQASIGILASIGTKFRLSDVLQAGLAFKYFLPVSKQTASLNSTPNISGVPTSGSTRLRSSDAEITGSSQVQILGGLQYLF